MVAKSSTSWPVDRLFHPFIGFQPSKAVQDFFHPQSDGDLEDLLGHNEVQSNSNQWPFQEPKLEVHTIYEAYVYKVI